MAALLANARCDTNDALFTFVRINKSIGLFSPLAFRR